MFLMDKVILILYYLEMVTPKKIIIQDLELADKEIKRLREENRKLKEDNRFLTKISKEYMKKEHIIEVTEFTELYKDDLEKENKKLKEERGKLVMNKA